MKLRKQKINIFLTHRQLVNEKVHYGKAFNKNNYILIQERNLNEGAFGLFLRSWLFGLFKFV